MIQSKTLRILGSLLALTSGVWEISAQNISDPTTPPRARLFTVSADLREEYDDNIFTTATDRVASMKTVIEPSFLFNYPMQDSTFSARYTLDATAFYHRDSTWDIAHDLVMRGTHEFGDRFSLDVRDRVHYAQEPEVEQGAVVAQVTGDYFNNTFTAQGLMQWTPKLSMISTFTNDYFDYREESEKANNRDANIFANDFRYQLLPSSALVVGGSYTNLSYFDRVQIPTGSFISRDWQTFSPYVGVDQTLSPEWVLSPRIGATYATYAASAIGDTITPYASLATSWQVGKDTSIDFLYTHTVSQTDVTSYSSQNSDSFSLTGNYRITPLISTHLTGYYNIGEDTANAALDPAQGSAYENTLGLAFRADYDFARYLAFEAGYYFDDVTSDVPGEQYSRNRIFLGVRATY